jgi:hypothetical protein
VALQSLKGSPPHLVGILWTSDQTVAKASTYTGQHNTKTRTHPCLKRDSNLRSQRPSDQGLRLRQRGHWDRQNETTFWNSVFVNCVKTSRSQGVRHRAESCMALRWW